jgi:nitrile hydratase accessory protein
MTTEANLALPISDEEPAFAEPWQAEAFATAMVLSRAGVFTWKEWTETFGEEIKRHPQRAGEEAGAAYYRQWLAALETLLSVRGLVNTSEIAETQEHWRRSYLNTEHGMPVAFSRNWRDAPAFDGHDHHHDHEDDHEIPRPVAVSAAHPIPPRR